MLIKAWNLLRSATEANNELRPAEVDDLHNRLVRMRAKQEGKADMVRKDLPLNATVKDPGRIKKGCIRWFAQAAASRMPRKGFYEDVLSRLSVTGQKSSLLEHEKAWAQHSMRYLSDEIWSADPFHDQKPTKSELEYRIVDIDRMLINTALNQPCSLQEAENTPNCHQQFESSQIKLITQQDDGPEGE